MRALIDLVAPVRCAACGVAADGDLCAGCALDLEPHTGTRCSRCDSPAPDAPGRCRQCRDLQGFDRARSLVVYRGPAARLVVALKRRGRSELARWQGALLGDLVRREGMEAAGVIVTHVPGGRGARTLGFDHTRLLAAGVAKRLGAPREDLLVRVREGPRQADVPLEGRRSNVAGRFRARPCGGRVLLVDDVFTTGATAEACALALLEGGARGVDVVTWARTLRRSGPRSGGW